MDLSKFQVNFLQLLLNWTKRVTSQGELYIEMFIKEATSYKLAYIDETHFLYNMQLKKNWLITPSCPDIGEARDIFFTMPSDRSTEAVHYNVFNKTVYIAVI